MAVIVKLQPSRLAVEPGSSGDIVVSIENDSERVYDYPIQVTGKAAAWASVTPPTVTVYAHESTTVRVSFAPPRKPEPNAGDVRFGIFVQAGQNPAEVSHEEGLVTVLPFVATTAELVPQTSRGSGRVKHEVAVTNGGNIDIEAEIEPTDPDRLLRFETRPDRLALLPGASGVTKLHVTPNDTFLNGPPVSRAFRVKVTSTKQEPFELHGALMQSAQLPSWLPRAVAGLVAVAVIGGVLFAAGVIPPKPPPSASPSSQANGSTPTPTPTPSPTPTPTPTPEVPTDQPTAPASDAPTPTPLPDFDLEPGQTQYILNNYVYICETPACEDLALKGLRLLANSLEAEYLGTTGAVFDYQNLPAESMPVIVAADGPFQWRSAITQESGTTDRVIVDFKPLMDKLGDVPYVYLEDPVLGPRRYVAQNGLSAQLVAMLFESPTIPPPTPIGSLRPPHEWDDILLDPGLIRGDN